MILPRAALAALLLRQNGIKTLFPPWTASDWIAQDDSVRGNGASYSKLNFYEASTIENRFDFPIAEFTGVLNYTALGGAGFASQRTIDEWPSLDISEYDELVLEIPFTDGKKYTINLKDTVPPAGVNDQPTISWGFDFQPASLPQIDHPSPGVQQPQVVVAIKDLVPTLNGRTVENVQLNTAAIKRISIMIRR